MSETKRNGRKQSPKKTNQRMPFPVLPGNQSEFDAWLREIYYSVGDLQRAAHILEDRGKLDTIGATKQMLSQVRGRIRTNLKLRGVHLDAA